MRAAKTSPEISCLTVLGVGYLRKASSRQPTLTGAKHFRQIYSEVLWHFYKDWG